MGYINCDDCMNDQEEEDDLKSSVTMGTCHGAQLLCIVSLLVLLQLVLGHADLAAPGPDHLCRAREKQLQCDNKVGDNVVIIHPRHFTFACGNVEQQSRQ